jgi:hypothetical protein
MTSTVEDRRNGLGKKMGHTQTSKIPVTTMAGKADLMRLQHSPLSEEPTKNPRFQRIRLDPPKLPDSPFTQPFLAEPAKTLFAYAV